MADDLLWRIRLSRGLSDKKAALLPETRPAAKSNSTPVRMSVSVGME